jgi:hypothetical protein
MPIDSLPETAIARICTVRKDRDWKYSLQSMPQKIIIFMIVFSFFRNVYLNRCFYPFFIENLVFRKKNLIFLLRRCQTKQK